ncbi:MAG: DUF924 family protein, partial [Candidatus Competibacter phosphatis]
MIVAGDGASGKTWLVQGLEAPSATLRASGGKCMIHSENIANSAEVLAFWFAEAVKPLWFASTPEFDEALRERFLATYRAAATGQSEDWE